MTPWTRQEKVSRMLALRLGGMLKRSLMSLAMGPAVMMAMVLFAVQRLARETSAAMLNSAPRLPRIWRVIFSMM